MPQGHMSETQTGAPREEERKSESFGEKLAALSEKADSLAEKAELLSDKLEKSKKKGPLARAATI